MGFLQSQFLPAFPGKDRAALQKQSLHSCCSVPPASAAHSLCSSFSQCDLAMPPLPHSLEYYAMLWQEACARGHGSSSCSPADDTGTAQDNVQQGVLLTSGRARPPTPPNPKTTRTEGSPPKQLMKIKPTTKPRTKFSKVELVWKKKDT